MPACDFTLTHGSTPEALYRVVRAGVRTQGGSITGSPQEGQIRFPSPLGAVEGNYISRSHSVRVLITRKPMLVSCAAIQSRLAELLAQVPPEVIDAPSEPLDPEETPQVSRPAPAGGDTEDWLWAEEQYQRSRVDVRVDVTQHDFEDELVLARPVGSPWPLYLTAAALAAGGLWLWRSRQV